MFILCLKKIVIFLMSAVSLFTASSGDKWADSYKDHEFPLIAADEQAADTLRILSFNIRCADVNGVSADDRKSIVVRQILEVMPDSVGLQEATSSWMQTLDHKLGLLYDWVGVDRDNGGSPLAKDAGESCPVFYLKARFRLLDSGSFWLSETPDEPSYGPGAACRRICTWAKLEDRKSGSVYVHVNTHFDHVSEQARAEGAGIVSGFIAENFADVPVVFTADMNTRDTGAAYAAMTQTFSDTRLLAADAETFGTFHACQPETHADYVIDYVLCSPQFSVDAYRTVTKGVDGRFVSDHFPIYADLRFAN